MSTVEHTVPRLLFSLTVVVALLIGGATVRITGPVRSAPARVASPVPRVAADRLDELDVHRLLAARAEHDRQVAWRLLAHLSALDALRRASVEARRVRSAPSHRTSLLPGAPTPAACPFADAIRSLWPADAADRMIRVAWRESRCRPDAVSPTGCLGLLQICWPLHRRLVAEVCGGAGARELLFSPGCNLRVGRALWGRAGWAPWRATA